MTQQIQPLLVFSSAYSLQLYAIGMFSAITWENLNMANLTLDEYTLYHSANLLACYELGSFEDDMSFDDFCHLCWRDYLCLHS